MALRALCQPTRIIRIRLFQELDRNVHVARSAELGVQPFQFTLQVNAFGIGKHREKNDIAAATG